MNCKIYLPEDWMYGDATSFYIDIIADYMSGMGYTVTKIRDIDSITPQDIVVTVASYMVRPVRKKSPKFIVNWFQGIAPEEYWFFGKHTKNPLNTLKRYLSSSFSDFYALRYSDFNFFVSQKMVSFYGKKYKYHRKNYFVMPCFNQNLNRNAFTDAKYSTPSFVYAGSMDGWQCFEKTVQTFIKIKKVVSDATLTVLTGQQDIAKNILAKYRVDAEVKYVQHNVIDEELSKYKYGFIIREDNIVNNVATPTKMNSYLANGIIPVFTDVVYAFRKPVGELKYAIPLDVQSNGLQKIFEIEKETISASQVYEDFKNLFDVFYSRDSYINKLSKTDIIQGVRNK